MSRYLPLLLFIGLTFLSCEDNDEPELTYSSINDGDFLEKYSGVYLKFSKTIPIELFDASSIVNYNELGTQVSDTIDVDSNLQYVGPDYFSIVYHSNFIKLNEDPQTLIYNSKTNSILLVAFTTVYYPDGTGEGFNTNQLYNQLTIGGENIDFILEPSSIRLVPNPYIVASTFQEEDFLRKIRFTHLPETAIIDIYKLDEEKYTRRLVKNSENSNMEWDLRDFNNQMVSSGFYMYNLGQDTLSDGYLNFHNQGYFNLALPEEN